MKWKIDHLDKKGKLMSDLKRDEIKYIRDLSKKHYERGDECFICGTAEDLQFHHFYSLTILWENWKKENKIVIKDVEHIMSVREDFRQAHMVELYDETITLCKTHHMDHLHRVYGKVPPLTTAQKQKRWCQRQRDKHYAKTTSNEA